jgi:hypothetical protein
MPKINIDHPCSLAPTEAYSKIKNFFETDQDIRRLDPNLKCEFTESSMTGRAFGNQFKMDFTVKNQGPGSVISVVVDLPLMLTPFKAKVQETIQRKLGKYLA